MSMNQILAEYYQTNGADKTASAEDHEKAAQYELFTKIAASNSIDLSKLSDAQVVQLYEQTFSKEAGEMPPQFRKKDDEEHEEKEEKDVEHEAKKEHEEKKAMADKLAEADFLGRTMAHAYVQELSKIAEQRETTANEWNVELPKLASAIDTLSMHRAFEMIQEFNAGAMEFNKTAAANAALDLFDEKVAAERIAQVHAQGLLGESVKVASAPDHQGAVEVRALETLEAAGYPVEWKQ